MRIDPLDDLAVQLEHEPQHAVRGGVLGAEINRVIGDLRLGRAGAGDLLVMRQGGGDLGHIAPPVIPAKAGISSREVSAACAEIPAFAGMTSRAGITRKEVTS